MNRLDNGQTGYAKAAFSNLDETLKSAGVDVTTSVLPRLTLTVGYDFTNTERESTRREFQIVAPSTFPSGAAHPAPGLSAQRAGHRYLRHRPDRNDGNRSGVCRATAHQRGLLFSCSRTLTDSLQLSLGARYERGQQEREAAPGVQHADQLRRVDQSRQLAMCCPQRRLRIGLREDMQVRVNASKTFARPQFRELMFQTYYDPETNRQYRGNPLLVDSEFVNAEARYEWYIAPEQRFSFAGFYKKIEKPIEAFTGFNDNTPVTSYANAPEALLYGAEVEAQKYIDLDAAGDGGLFASRRAVLIGNYTYTSSDIKVGGERYGERVRHDDAAGEQLLHRRQPADRPGRTISSTCSSGSKTRGACRSRRFCCPTRASA